MTNNINNPVLEAIKSRRSTRAFTAEPVDRTELAAILEAGSWAPSGRSYQGWHFSALNTPKETARLAAAVRQALDLPETYCFYNAPCHIIVSYEASHQHAWLDGTAAVENMLLAAESLGLAACWINQIRVCCDNPTVRSLLTEFGIPEDHMVIASIALGHGAETPAPKPRKEGVITIID